MNVEDSSPRVAAITGATGAIGKAIAYQLASQKHHVFLLARNESKAKQAVSYIIQKTGNKNVHFSLVDVSRKSSIKKLSKQWKRPLHVLINNAAIAPPRRKETPEKIELQFATNVLGYFWMIQELKDVLKKSMPARIINIASYWASDLDLKDLEFKKRPYDNRTAYRQSKQANRMLTVAFGKRFEKTDITVNSCHPGDVNSTLSNKLGFRGHESPEKGAETPVWLATSPIGGELTGKYFEHKKEYPCPFGKNSEAVERLFQICNSY